MAEPKTDARVERVCAFYRELTAGTLAGIGDLYAEDALFVDPAGEVRGREKLRAHFAALMESVSRCAFDFDCALCREDEAALFWRMTLAAQKLNGGKVYEVPGASRLTFGGDGKIKLHRDYFDLGALLYERLPVVGAAARGLRRRLAARG